MSNTFNLNEIESRQQADEAGTVLTLVDEHGKPYIGVDGSKSTITVLGSRAKSVRLARLRNSMAFARLRADGAELGVEETLIAVDDASLEVAVAATKAWTGIVSDGTPVPCTPENARRLYVAAPHIVAQVAKAHAAAQAAQASTEKVTKAGRAKPRTHRHRNK